MYYIICVNSKQTSLTRQKTSDTRCTSNNIHALCIRHQLNSETTLDYAPTIYVLVWLYRAIIQITIILTWSQNRGEMKKHRSQLST
jgi:hypothetical protein